MSIQQFLLWIIIVGAAYAAFASYRAKTRVYCTFNRRDRTTGHKWAKAKNGERIEFEGGWYYVDTSCVTLEALDSGFNMLFPTMVRKLEFSYRSKWPKDPQTGDALPETPEMRKNLNKREDIEALNKGTQQAFGKTAKTGILGGGWLPIILVVGVVASVYFIWQLMGRIDQLGNAINVLQSMMMGQ